MHVGRSGGDGRPAATSVTALRSLVHDDEAGDQGEDRSDDAAAVGRGRSRWPARCSTLRRRERAPDGQSRSRHCPDRPDRPPFGGTVCPQAAGAQDSAQGRRFFNAAIARVAPAMAGSRPVAQPDLADMRFDLPPERRQHAAGQRNGQQADGEPDHAGPGGFHQPGDECAGKGNGARNGGARVMKRMAGPAESDTPLGHEG